MRAAGWNEGTLVLLLAGGQGERLYPLTKKRAKPAVPFGGLYRIVDFTLSNCLNSGFKRIYVLTQHQSLSLDRHLRLAWSILHPELGEFIQTVPPQLQLVSRWYTGTADAVFQNLHVLEEERPEWVLILSGDHIYRMDYNPLLQFHVGHAADLTVACTEVPRTDATRMGVLELDRAARVRTFAEKPAQPAPLQRRPDCALVNMGVYLFRTETLVRAVIADAKGDSAHDFGHNIIPNLIARHCRVVGFDIVERCPPERHYWQDVGTLDSYFAANIELLAARPPFDLFDASWPVRMYSGQHPPALMRRAGDEEARVVDSIVSPGCIVSGGSVVRSVLSPEVFVGAGAVVEESILMPGVRVGDRSQVRRAIVDERVVVPPGMRIGYDHALDRRRFVLTDGGVVIVPEGTVLT
ncbi:MAG: glucose-1-phosphate adenylyltransferase [Candidatus Binatia bacterium]